MNQVVRIRDWLRTHPPAIDAGLAAVVLTIVLCGLSFGPHSDLYPVGPMDLALSVVSCAALLLRRRRPIAVLLFTCTTTLGHVLAAGDNVRGPVFGAAVVALYTVASRTDRSTTWRIGVATAVGLTAAAMLFGDRPWYAEENFGLLTWIGLAAAAGDAVRSRRAYIAAVEERAERAERTREEEAKRRVAEERMRIARELHDVVAHHIALVNVQAGVAAHVMDSRPDQAKLALAHVREASRSALGELRAMVGLLRQSGDPEAPMEPAPGLGVLGQLVEGFHRTGLPVEVTVTGGARPAADDRAAGAAADGAGPLPASVDLTAYRVVQESLTNIHKHGGAGSRAKVSIVRVRDAVEVTVLDDGGCPRTAGGGRGASAEDTGGHGLMGMRERTAALGGAWEAGPRPEGGFGVRVRLPLAAGAGNDTTTGESR